MKLAISNIAWDETLDLQMYDRMKQYGYSGLEIAPTRIFGENPYKNLKKAAEWSLEFKTKYHFEIPSMQSIWYGRTETIFGSKEERDALVQYTRLAIEFAAEIGCKNLVFGCPKNRSFPSGADTSVAVPFFKTIGDYAAADGVVIGLEANPVIYHTNFLNDTKAALEFIKQVDSKGLKLNLDIGTMIYNEESILDLKGWVPYISHVHISEPYLKNIKERLLHREAKRLLEEEGYDGYVSIEMSRQESISAIFSTMRYVWRVFA